MTSLDEFFAPADFSEIRAQGITDYGIDICGVYCQQTGRQIGTFDDFVIQFAIEEESSDDPDELLDALMSRTIASMRPSPMLNRPDRVTLRNLAEKHPVDIAAFLVNRLHSNRYLATHRDFEILEPHIAKIHCYRRFASLAAAGVDLSRWTHLLLELDSKRNLHDLRPPCVALDDSNKWVLSGSGQPLLFLLVPEDAAELLAVFEAWTFQRVKESDKRDNLVLPVNQMMRGNPMSGPAYVRSWLTNPEFAGKRYEQEAKQRNRVVKPVSEKTQRQRAQTAKMNEFLGLLDGILDGDNIVESPKPVKPKVLTGGMLFAKRESIA